MRPRRGPALNASPLVTPGFVVLPLAVAAGFVLACDWADRRLGEDAGGRRRRTIGMAAGALALLLVTGLVAASGVLRRFDAFSGQNYDIVTGITAGLLGGWLARGRVPRGVVTAWNALGLVLLLNVVTVAVVSTPLFRWFGHDRLDPGLGPGISR